MRTLSLPHEHGGYLTIAGAAATGVALAHARGSALAVGAVVAAAFFARAPIEQLARGRGAALDGPAVAVLTAVALSGAIALGGAWAAVALVVATAIVCGSWAARSARAQRASWFETLGMGALGASAGLVALAGGAAPRLCVAVALVIGVHTALAVPLVRSEVRPRERALAANVGWAALAVVATAALALVLFGRGGFAFALAPRALHALARTRPAATVAKPIRPNVVGVRETAMLVVAIVLVLVA